MKKSNPVKNIVHFQISAAILVVPHISSAKAVQRFTKASKLCTLTPSTSVGKSPHFTASFVLTKQNKKDP